MLCRYPGLGGEAGEWGDRLGRHRRGVRGVEAGEPDALVQTRVIVQVVAEFLLLRSCVGRCAMLDSE